MSVNDLFLYQCEMDNPYLYYLVSLKVNIETSVVWPSFKISSVSLRSGSVGGTIVGSASPQKLYWQNTKCDNEGGKPAAFFTVT